MAGHPAYEMTKYTRMQCLLLAVWLMLEPLLYKRARSAPLFPQLMSSSGLQSVALKVLL